MARLLPARRPTARQPTRQPLIAQMIAAGLVGRKGKGGFYRLSRVNGGRSRKPSTSAPATIAESQSSSRQPCRRQGGRLAGAGRPTRTGPAAMPGRAERDAGLRSRAGADDLRHRRRRRCGHAPRLQLVVRAVRADRPAGHRLVRGAAAAEGRPVPALLERRGGSAVLSGRGAGWSSWGRRRLPRCSGPDGMLLLADIKRRAGHCCTMAPPRSGISATAWPASSSPRR